MITIMSRLIEVLLPLLREQQSLAAGTILFMRGDAVRFLHVVHQGHVHLTRFDENGTPAVMQRATPGTVLAESSIFSSVYHCDAVVVRDTIVGRASMSLVREALAADPTLMSELARHLAGEVQRVRVRVEILSKKTVRERLDAWLTFNDGSLPPRGTWRAIAEDIGVTPEAFYRELKLRRSS